MEKHFNIRAVPAILLGEPSDKLFIFVHGQGGSKEEAVPFAQLACEKGWQVLGVDLPQHGGRNDEATFDPWHAVPELREVCEYARAGWKTLALRANSIGSWFSLMAFPQEALSLCLLVSPLLDMEHVIGCMMRCAGVSPEQLEREKTIPTGFGPALSWEYYLFAREHHIESWNAPTRILRAEKDEQVDVCTMDAFAGRFGCDVTVMKNGEHWFHTPEELAFLARWERESLV